MSHRDWPINIPETPDRYSKKSEKTFSVIKDWESRTFRLWCDTAKCHADTNCVDLTETQLVELRDALTALIETHAKEPWYDDMEEEAPHGR